MKKLFQFICTLLLATAVAAGMSQLTVMANDEIHVTIDGTQVNFTGQGPVIVEGRTLVPVRGVFEQLGFVPAWDGDARQATLTRADYTIVITIGSYVFTTNGINYELDVPAQIIDGSTMLPIRAVLESVGYTLDWDGSTSTVMITAGPTEEEPVQPIAAANTILFGGHRWLVLEEQSDRMLIISENIIERRPFNRNMAVSWQTSDMRSYLNGDFLNSFSAADRARILETTVINAGNPWFPITDNPWFDRNGRNNTTDRIFLLSLDELVRYFGDSGQLQNRPDRDTWFIQDAYNSARTAHYNGSPNMWWLRTHGSAYGAVFIGEEGSVGVGGLTGDASVVGVRPAMWISR